MRSCASILKPQGKGKWMHFIPLINLCSGNKVYSSVYTTELQCTPHSLGSSKGLGHWTGTGTTQRTEQNLQKFASSAAIRLLGRWFPLLKRLCPAHASKENQQQPYTGERTQTCGAQVGADAWAGLLAPQGGAGFHTALSAFPGLMDRVWSHPDIPNLPHGLYRTLNSVSRDRHIFLQEFWIMTKLDNFAIFAAPNSQTQLYK